MELDFLSFALGFTIGTAILIIGMLVGKVQDAGGIRKAFVGEKPVPLEDIPGTDEYYQKALLSPEEGGHADHVDPFEQELIELNRHSGE
jgi:hypothetical protein